MTRPDGVSASEWERAVLVASGDRERLSRLVSRGVVRRVRGERALPLPSRVNLAIRSNRKNRRRRR